MGHGDGDDGPTFQPPVYKATPGEPSGFSQPLIKPQDQELFGEVIRYLAHWNVHVALSGSTLLNAANGKPQQYSDLDLLVMGDEIPLKQAYLGIFNVHPLNLGFSPSHPAENYSVSPTHGQRSYVGTIVDEGVKITNGPTIIDISFKVNSRHQK